MLTRNADGNYSALKEADGTLGDAKAVLIQTAPNTDAPQQVLVLRGYAIINKNKLLFDSSVVKKDEAVQGTTNKQTGNSAHTLVRLHSTLTTEASHLYHTYNSKILWTRKNTFSCARQGLKHLRSYSPQVHCNGCTEQQPMMTAGKSATSHCLPTSWQGWLLRTVQPKVSIDH